MSVKAKIYCIIPLSYTVCLEYKYTELMFITKRCDGKLKIDPIQHKT